MEVFNKQILIDRETRLNIGISVTQEKNRFYETTKIFKSSRKIVKCQYSGEKVVQSIRFFTPAFKGLEQIGRSQSAQLRELLPTLFSRVGTHPSIINKDI